MTTRAKRLAVAVTGPMGEIGRSLLAALERSDHVGRVLGMARRPFDPAEHGRTKVEYRQGDVLDRESVDALVAAIEGRGTPGVYNLAWDGTITMTDVGRELRSTPQYEAEQTMRETIAGARAAGIV